MSRRRRRQEQARERAKRDETRSRETAHTREAQSGGGSNPAQDGVSRSSDQVLVVAEEESISDHVGARAKLVPADAVSQRAFVADLMVTKVWSTKQHAGAVAAAWGMTGRAVENIATEAGRWLKIIVGPEERDRLREKLVVKTHEVLDQVRTPRDLEAVGKVALPLAGVAQGGPVVQVVIDGAKPLALTDREAGEALKLTQQFFIDRYPELFVEFLEYVGLREAPALPAGGE